LRFLRKGAEFAKRAQLECKAKLWRGLWIWNSCFCSFIAGLFTKIHHHRDFCHSRLATFSLLADSSPDKSRLMNWSRSAAGMFRSLKWGELTSAALVTEVQWSWSAYSPDGVPIAFQIMNRIQLGEYWFWAAGDCVKARTVITHNLTVQISFHPQEDPSGWHIALFPDLPLAASCCKFAFAEFHPSASYPQTLLFNISVTFAIMRVRFRISRTDLSKTRRNPSEWLLHKAMPSSPGSPHRAHSEADPSYSQITLLHHSE
jgi:hypothetical protein